MLDGLVRIAGDPRPEDLRHGDAGVSHTQLVKIPERIKRYFGGLEDGSLAMTLWLFASFVILIVLGVVLRLPTMVFSVIFGSLLFLVGNHNMQKQRPRDSIKRVVGGLKTSTFVDHPSFSPGIRRGLAGMGKRLWTPRWITTAVDVRNDGLIWNLTESPFGFESVLLRWSDMKQVRTAKPAFYTYLTVELFGGPPVIVRIDRYDQSGIAEQMRLHGVAVNS
jgi:hypothetical protein